MRSKGKGSLPPLPVDYRGDVVTLIIPTAGRAGLLRMALQSVDGQTARARIGRIIVSENGRDRASERVCRAFPHLPIKYVFRDPALEPIEHGRALMREFLQGDFTGILHDDDAWAPGHLEAALGALEARPEASIYGANFVVYRDRLLPESYDLCAWFGANYPADGTVWELSAEGVLFASLLGLVVHYSSMIARTQALAQAAYVFDLGNPFDNDRMVLVALSRLGPVLFNPEAMVVVRHHGAQDTERYDQQARSGQMARTTEWMVASSRKSWSALAADMARRLGECPDPQEKANLLRFAALRPWCLPEIACHLDRHSDAEFFAQYDAARALYSGNPAIPDDGR